MWLDALQWTKNHLFEFVWNCRLLTVILACEPFGCMKYISKLCSLEMQSQELNRSEILKF